MKFNCRRENRIRKLRFSTIKYWGPWWSLRSLRILNQFLVKCCLSLEILWCLYDFILSFLSQRNDFLLPNTMVPLLMVRISRLRVRIFDPCLQYILYTYILYYPHIMLDESTSNLIMISSLLLDPSYFAELPTVVPALLPSLTSRSPRCFSSRVAHIYCTLDFSFGRSPRNRSMVINYASKYPAACPFW